MSDDQDPWRVDDDILITFLVAGLLFTALCLGPLFLLQLQALPARVLERCAECSCNVSDAMPKES